jgi:hypothetical protein
MKERPYKDYEEFLDGEETSFTEEEVREKEEFQETVELFSLLNSLPRKKAPRDFERNLYSRLGISYVPIHRKVLTLVGMVLFSSILYLFGRTAFNSLSAQMSVSSVSQFFSQVSMKISQFVTLMRVGQHLKDILLAFTNPWLFVGLAFVSSILMMTLIFVAREVKKKAVLLIRF